MKKCLLTYIFGAILFTGIHSNSQVTQEWVSRYNGTGNGNDAGFSLAIDGIGNVYVTGGSVGNGTGGDFVTVKYNSSGNQQWVQRYNGPANSGDAASSIAVDLLGNVYVTGRSTGIGTFYDYVTIKYNSSGDLVWIQRFNGPANRDDYARSIAVDLAGNVYVTGWISAGEAFDDYATIKYNSLGVQEWIRRYNGPGNNADIAYSLAIDISGNVYVTGRSAGSETSYDYATIKYNTFGDSVWIRRYNGPENDFDDAKSIKVDISGNVYVTGTSAGIGTSSDYLTIKYNSTGNQQWIQRYDGPANSHDEANSLAIDLSGNVYITGISMGVGTSGDYATVKYNSSGFQQWVQRYNVPGSGIDDAHSIAIDGLGNVYVTGESMESITSVYDYATVKYSTDGVQQWVKRFNGAGNGLDRAYSIAVDGSGNVYVLGESLGSGINMDYATIKYSQTIGIQPISNVIPKEFSLSQNYPNPFNPTTNFEFRIADFGFVNLIIYDAMGREVEALVNEELKPGTYKAEWDASNFTSGVYFYRLTSGGYIETKRMVLIK